MLPEKHKFHIYNGTGVTLDFSTNSANEAATATARRWKLDSSGALVLEGTEKTLVTAATDLADATSEEGSEIDNGTDKYLGLEGVLEVKTDNASANGPVELYVEWSTDGGTSYPSDGANFATGTNEREHLQFVTSVFLNGSVEKRKPFAL